jgi:hypothetical protein
MIRLSEAFLELGTSHGADDATARELWREA